MLFTIPSNKKTAWFVAIVCNPIVCLRPFMSQYKRAIISTLLLPQARAMSTSSTSSKAGLIFLHGLGDTPSGWKAIQRQLPSIEPSLSNVEYVFPHAPTIPITINGGMQMPGWFDLYDWPIGIGCTNDDEVSKLVRLSLFGCFILFTVFKTTNISNIYFTTSLFSRFDFCNNVRMKRD